MYEEGGGTGQTHAPAGYTRRKEPVGLIFLSRFWTLRPTRENLFESRLLLHHIVCFGTRVSFAFSLVSQAGSQCITTSIEGAVAGVYGLSCPSPDLNHISGSHFLQSHTVSSMMMPSAMKGLSCNVMLNIATVAK